MTHLVAGQACCAVCGEVAYVLYGSENSATDTGWSATFSGVCCCLQLPQVGDDVARISPPLKDTVKHDQGDFTWFQVNLSNSIHIRT